MQINLLAERTKEISQKIWSVQSTKQRDEKRPKFGKVASIFLLGEEDCKSMQTFAVNLQQILDKDRSDVNHVYPLGPSRTAEAAQHNF